MEVIEGPVQQVRMGAEVSASNGNATTTHVATFRMGRTAVRIESRKAIMIGDGDAVAVAGLEGRDGVFSGLAYRNAATGARGSTDPGMAQTVASLLVAICSAIAILGDLVVASNGRGGMALFALLFLIPSSRILRRALRSRKASAPWTDGLLRAARHHPRAEPTHVGVSDKKMKKLLQLLEHVPIDRRICHLCKSADLDADDGTAGPVQSTVASPQAVVPWSSSGTWPCQRGQVPAAFIAAEAVFVGLWAGWSLPG